MWRVLIVEDDSQTRKFFAESVSNCPDLTLAAALESVGEAKSWLLSNANQVDALLIDLGLPDGSGLEVIRHAKQLNSRIEPLVISMFGDEDNVLASIEAGALGYIHKDSTPASIASTILGMRSGASPISPMIARLVLSKYQNAKMNEQQPGLVPVVASKSVSANHDALLTQRETEVLTLISQGYSYGEIARMRNLSVNTIQTHIKSLYRKLSVNSKTEAVFEATRMGLLPHAI